VALPVLHAQDPTAPASTETPLKFTAILDAFYSQDLNHPASGLGGFRNFDWKQGLELNAAEINLERDGPEFGFRLDAGLGEMFRSMNLSDPWGGPNRYISQAFVSYKPRKNGLRFDFGKFYTSVGAEAAETYNNFNYSRSLLFTLGEPYYHFGFRATIPLTASFSAGVQLVNGWNDVRDNNSGKSVALVSTWTHPKWGWSEVYMTGPEKSGTDPGFRRLYDSVFTVSPNRWANAYVEGLWAMDRRIGGGKDQWSGVAGTAKFSLPKNWSLSQRVERFYDSTGFTTGTPQHLTEATNTLDYRPARFLVVRSEFRRDWSDQNVFEKRGSPRASKGPDNSAAGVDLCRHGEALSSRAIDRAAFSLDPTAPRDTPAHCSRRATPTTERRGRWRK
jgi:hypothetical protein